MNILLTGVTGLLGSYMVKVWGNSGNLYGIYKGNYSVSDSARVKYFMADVQNKTKIDDIFRNNSIDAVIHAAGEARVDFCEKNYEESRLSNIVGTRNVIELCGIYGSKLAYISTNAVFDGTRPPYKEDDIPNPVNAYGRIKLECEKLVRKSSGDFLIIRPILMYGWNRSEERSNVATWILEKLRQGEQVRLVDDIFDNPLYALQCAEIILKLIEKNKSGTYHIAGGDVVNRYQFGLILAEIFGCDKNAIRPVRNDCFKDIAPRPRDTSYDTGKIRRELGVRPLDVREGLLKMAKEKNCARASSAV